VCNLPNRKKEKGRKRKSFYANMVEKAALA
jgi:hypothetical protein